MLRRLKLRTRIIGIVLFLSIAATGIGVFSYVIIHDLGVVIHDIAEEDIPLVRAVTQITEQLLDQSVRFSAIQQYAKVHNKEKFIHEEDRFKEAGERFIDVVKEGRSIAQMGVAAAHSETEKEEFLKIKKLLERTEAEFGEYRHLSEQVIHALFVESFGDERGKLKKKSHGGGHDAHAGGHGAAEDEDSEAYIRSHFTEAVEKMEHETETLMGEIEEALELTDELTRNLMTKAKNKQQMANKMLVVLILSVVIIGLGLSLAVTIPATRSLRKASDSLSESAQSVTMASDEISATSGILAENASHQAASLEESTAALSEINNKAQENARSTQQTLSLMKETDDSFKRVHKTIDQLNQAAKNASLAGEQVQRGVKALRDTILQINMLSTNATAEAKREEKESLAVFTDEIKSFSNKAFDAVKDIEKRLETSQEGIESALSLFQAGEGDIRDVAQSITKSAQVVEQVDVSSREQAHGIYEIEQAIEQLNESTQSNAATSEESSAASAALAEQAHFMLTVVQQLTNLVEGEKKGSETAQEETGTDTAAAQDDYEKWEN
ncbi:hypothetical protein ACQZV8_05370 [Magnetococcales bacterium HHB-1]